MVIWLTDNSNNNIDDDNVYQKLMVMGDDVDDDLSAQGTSCECPESQLSHELPSKDLPSLNTRMVKTMMIMIAMMTVMMVMVMVIALQRSPLPEHQDGKNYDLCPH